MTMMDFKVRPFEKLASDNDLDSMTIGRIEGTEFIWRVLGRTLALKTTRVLQDIRGSYAVIQECELEIEPAWFLIVEAEHDEDDDTVGCHIGLSYNPNLAALVLEAQCQGYDLTTANILCPPRQSTDVYFTWDGQVNGCALLAMK